MADKLYWTDYGGHKVQRSELVDLVTDIPGAGIVLDLSAGKMYWPDPFEGKRNLRANLDGSQIENLSTGLGIHGGIALDPAQNTMYWADSDTDKVQCSNLDGSNVATVVTGHGGPCGLALVVN